MPEQKTAPSSKYFRFYQWVVILAGSAAFLYTVSRISASIFSASYLIFCFITLVFASRISVQIPRTKGHISVSDTFIFLSILVFGGEAGILLSTFDAVPTSYKLAKKRITLFLTSPCL